MEEHTTPIHPDDPAGMDICSTLYLTCFQVAIKTVNEYGDDRTKQALRVRVEQVCKEFGPMGTGLFKALHTTGIMK